MIAITVFMLNFLANSADFTLPRDAVFSIGGGLDQPSLAMRVDGSRNLRIEPDAKTGLNLLMDILDFQLKLTFPVDIHLFGWTDRQGFWDEQVHYAADSFSFRWGYQKYEGFTVKSATGFFSRDDITQQQFYFSSLIRVGGEMPLRYMIEKGQLRRGHYHTAVVSVEWQSLQISARRPLLEDFNLSLEDLDYIEATQNHSLLTGGGYIYGYAHPRVLLTTSLLLNTGLTRQDLSANDRRRQRLTAAGWSLEARSRCSVFFSGHQTLFVEALWKESTMALSRHDLQSVGSAFEIGYLYSF